MSGLLAIVLAVSPLTSLAQDVWPPPPPQRQDRGRPGAAASSQAEARIPGHFLEGFKGFERALELQQETGADIFLYIGKKSPPNERGLTSWFETRGLKAGEVQRYLRDYIKVQIILPSDARTQEIADRYGTRTGPAVHIIHTNRFSRSVAVFNWPDGKPELKTPDELVELIRSNSGPRYQQ